MFGFFKKRAGKSEATRTAGGPIISALLLEGESFPTDAFLIGHPGKVIRLEP